MIKLRVVTLRYTECNQCGPAESATTVEAFDSNGCRDGIRLKFKLKQSIVSSTKVPLRKSERWASQTNTVEEIMRATSEAKKWSEPWRKPH